MSPGRPTHIALALLSLCLTSGCAHGRSSESLAAFGLATVSVGAAVASGCFDLDEDDHDECDYDDSEGDPEVGLPIMGFGAAILGMALVADAIED